MIKHGQKLPADCLEKLPGVVEAISSYPEVNAFFSYGSLASNKMKPLSDLDFGVLFYDRFDKYKRFKKQSRLLNLMIDRLGTEEADLVAMSDAPIRFSYNIIQTGKLLFCKKRGELADFIEDVVQKYLDYSVFRKRADDIFLKGIGYYG